MDVLERLGRLLQPEERLPVRVREDAKQRFLQVLAAVVGVGEAVLGPGEVDRDEFVEQPVELLGVVVDATAEIIGDGT